jgi:D-alanyl-D-alanine dipeptidase
MPKLADLLNRPVPNLREAREAKATYRDYPLDSSSPRNAEPLVDIAQHGIAGQSYYSRPNGATGEPVPGVEPTILVRRSVAEKLAAINYELQQSDELAEIFHGRVELYVDEGLRSLAVQRRLYEETFPALIRVQHPMWSEAEVLARRDQLSARPSDNSSSPSPHLTGAAVDLKLRYAQDRLGFVPHVMVPMGGAHTTMGEATNPDFFEHKKSLTKDDEIARRNRRVFYWVMRGALNGDDPGFAVNPTEWWHWSFGDQMWAQSTTAPTAFFAAPPR